MAQPTVQDRAKAQQNLNQQRIQHLRNQGWGDFGAEAKPNTSAETTSEFDSSLLYFTPDQIKAMETSKTEPKPASNGFKNPFLEATPQIEYAPQIQSTPQVEELQKVVEIEEKQIEHDEARLFEALKSETEFAMDGSLNFAQATETFEPVQQPAMTLGHEPELPPEHREMSSIDLRTPQEEQAKGDFDPDYFFKTSGRLAYEGAYNFGNFIIKKTLNAKNFIDTKTALIDDLLFKQIFGWGQEQAPSTPEQKTAEEKKRQTSTNKRIFYDALRAGIRGLISTEQRRALKNRIEAINRSLKRGNLSYEGIIDEQTGQIRETVLVESEKANSQKSEEELKAEKRQKLMLAGQAKAKKGPGITTSMDKAHNFNNAAKLAG